jgi:hypothetical protein
VRVRRTALGVITYIADEAQRMHRAGDFFNLHILIFEGGPMPALPWVQRETMVPGMHFIEPLDGVVQGPTGEDAFRGRRVRA